jgi:hypothetical protein
MDIYELLRAEAKAKKAGEPVKEQYGRISIDLSTARTDEELHISGNQITIAQCDGGATTTYFKLNSKHSRKVYPHEITKVLGNFGGVYLSNTAEPGKTLTIYLGRDIFIFPARAQAMRVLKTDGTTINPVRDERYKAHTGGHLKVAVAVADTAKQVIATSTKVKWAIISVEDYDCRWGFSSTVARAAEIGQGVAKNSFIAVEYCDLSDIWFVNKTAGAGELPVFQIEYVEEA